MTQLNRDIRKATRMAKKTVAEFNRNYARSPASMTFYGEGDDYFAVMSHAFLTLGVVQLADEADSIDVPLVTHTYPETRHYSAVVYASVELQHMVSLEAVGDGAVVSAAAIAFTAGRRFLEEQDIDDSDLPDASRRTITDEELGYRLTELVDVFFGRERTNDLMVHCRITPIVERDYLADLIEWAPRAQELLDELWETADARELATATN